MIPVFQILIKMTTILLQLYIKSINILVVSIPIPRNTCFSLCVSLASQKLLENRITS